MWLSTGKVTEIVELTIKKRSWESFEAGEKAEEARGVIWIQITCQCYMKSSTSHLTVDSIKVIWEIHWTLGLLGDFLKVAGFTCVQKLKGKGRWFPNQTDRSVCSASAKPQLCVFDVVFNWQTAEVLKLNMCFTSEEQYFLLLWSSPALVSYWFPCFISLPD